MTTRQVLRYPDPVLKRPARILSDDDHALVESVARDLIDTMRAHAGCVGLAAPQIGEGVRMVIVDVSEHPRATRNNGLLVLVNPVVARASGSEVAREGCLSIPDLTANVRRATDVLVEGTDLEGSPRAVEAEGFEARCLQHEIDHLDGLLFLDRVASLTTDVFRRLRYR
jgi:peptide deformylase